jgi:hypothetical protein
MLSETSPNVLKEFEAYYKTKHPKSQFNPDKITLRILHEYLTFVEEVLAPRYELENIKILLTESPTRSVLICQKLPNTKTLWILTSRHYLGYIPYDLTENFPDFASKLKETINKYKSIIELVISNLLQDPSEEEWTDIKTWQYILLTTAKSINKKFIGFQITHAYEFLENALLEKKEHLTIPSYIYRPALSEILKNKLKTEVQFAEFGEYLTPICNIQTSIDNFHFMYPDLSTEKKVSVNIKKIDEFNRKTNEYLKKVYSKVKTTIQTLNVITKLLQ